MKYKAIVFDLDGTLLYTLGDIRSSLNHALENLNFPSLELKRVRSLVGNGLERLAGDAVPPGTPPEVIQRIYLDLKDHYKRDPVGESIPYPGIPEMLHSLHDAGIALALWSNKDQDLVDSICASLFPGFFDLQIGRKQGIAPKPSPDGGRIIPEILNASPGDILYVGDSEVDLRTAEGMGFHCVAVSWGYRDRDVLDKAGARIIIDHPEELPPLLEQ